MNEKVREEAKQDRIVIFNEVIDVMKALHYIASTTHPNKDGEPLDVTLGQPKAGVKRNTTQEMLRTGEGDEEEDSRFLIDKELIIESWKRYRPDENFNDGKEEDNSTTILSNKNFVTVVGENFVDKIKNKIKNRNNADFEIEKPEDEHDGNENASEAISEVPEEELEIIDTFLCRFLLSSDSNQKGEVNLRLALNALPTRVNDYNFDKINLINFSVVQLSLIAFQNDDKDELFNFYDRRNMKRLYKLRAKSKENIEDIGYLQDISTRLIEKISSMFNLSKKDLDRGQNDGSRYNRFDKSDSASEF